MVYLIICIHVYIIPRYFCLFHKFLFVLIMPFFSKILLPCSFFCNILNHRIFTVRLIGLNKNHIILCTALSFNVYSIAEMPRSLDIDRHVRAGQFVKLAIHVLLGGKMPALLEEKLSDLWNIVRTDSPQRHVRAAEIASDIYSLCIEQITETELCKSWRYYIYPSPLWMIELYLREMTINML